MAKSLAGRAFQLYARCLARAPYKTQAATTAALWAAGDMLSQKIEGKQVFSKQMDWRRTMATALYGGACIGPFGHFWYLNLDKVARMYYKAGSASFITFKVVADTAIFGPLHIAAFFSYMVLFEGGGWQVRVWGSATPDIFTLLVHRTSVPSCARTFGPRLLLRWPYGQHFRCASYAKSCIFE